MWTALRKSIVSHFYELLCSAVQTTARHNIHISRLYFPLSRCRWRGCVRNAVKPETGVKIIVFSQYPLRKLLWLIDIPCVLLALTSQPSWIITPLGLNGGRAAPREVTYCS